MSLSTDPQGFDRTKALTIKVTGVAPYATHTVYGPTGKLLGSFTEESSAITFRDNVALEHVF